MVYFKFEQGKKIITALSVGLSIIAVLFLAMARESYAITVMFLLLFIKSGLLYKQAKVRLYKGEIDLALESGLNALKSIIINFGI